MAKRAETHPYPPDLPLCGLCHAGYDLLHSGPGYVSCRGFLLGFLLPAAYFRSLRRLPTKCFPKNRGVITSIVMIASSVANYAVLNVASLLTKIGGTEGPRMVVLFNMAVTLIGILLAAVLTRDSIKTRNLRHNRRRKRRRTRTGGRRSAGCYKIPDRIN